MEVFTPTLLSFHPRVCMFSQNKCCSTTRSHEGGVGNSTGKAKSTKLMHTEKIILILNNSTNIHVCSPDRDLTRLETNFVQQSAESLVCKDNYNQSISLFHNELSKKSPFPMNL